MYIKGKDKRDKFISQQVKNIAYNVHFQIFVGNCRNLKNAYICLHSNLCFFIIYIDSLEFQ